VLFVPGRIEGPASNEDPGATTPGGAWPSRLDADRVILATTRWEHLLTGLPDARPPGPPALQLRLELPAPPFRALIQGETCSLESQADGRVIVRGLVPTTAQALLADAVALVPALAGARLSATLADLPVETGNAQPSLGEASLAGLILAAGHFTHEVLLAPITARLVGQLLRGMKTIVPLRPFRSSSLRP
jgi:glycine/D-amino acid oxidase-like deaminating enzyme